MHLKSNLSKRMSDWQLDHTFLQLFPQALHGRPTNTCQAENSCNERHKPVEGEQSGCVMVYVCIIFKNCISCLGAGGTAIHVTFPFASVFSSVDLQCGGNYTDPEGLFSADLSGPFTHNRQCIYTIRQPLGEQVQVHFTHVELEGQSGCSQSYIEVTFATQWPSDGVYQHFSYSVEQKSSHDCWVCSIQISWMTWMRVLQFWVLSQTYRIRTSRAQAQQSVF